MLNFRRLAALLGLTVALAASALPLPARAVPVEGEKVREPAAETADATIVRMLDAALTGSFKTYLELLHPEERSTPEQRAQRERYEWKRFQKQARWYVTAEKPTTFVVTRRDTVSGGKVKIFLQDQVHNDRSPVPVQLTREGDRWFVVTNSL